MPTEGSGRGFRNGSSHIYSNSSSFLDCYSAIKSVANTSSSSPNPQQQHRLVALSSDEPLNYYFITEKQEQLEANSSKYRESPDAVPSASSSTATAATTGTTSTRNSLLVEMQSPWSNSNATTSSGGGGGGGVGVVDTLPHHQPLHTHHQPQSLSLAHLMMNDSKGENEDENEDDDKNHKDVLPLPDRMSAAPAPRIITTTMIPGRSSLGQFIERSTSAPPLSSSTTHANASTVAGGGGGGHFFMASSSTAANRVLKGDTSNSSTNNSHVFESSNHHQGRDHALLGNDLLELMSRTYPESNRDHGLEPAWDSTDKQQRPSMNSFAGRPRGASDAAAYSTQRGGAVVEVPEEEEEEADDLAMLLSQGASNNMNSGRMTAPSFLHSNFILNHDNSSNNDHRTAGLTLQRPTSASGASNSSSDGGGGGSGLGSSGFGGNSGLAHLGLGNGLVRSQSAAPTLHGSTSLGPPPGLSLNQSDSFVQQAPRAPLPSLTRRSASAGILDSNHPHHQQQHALRPAAKTLMDLIQEDYPVEPRLSEEESPQNYQFQENLQNGMTGHQSIEIQHQEQHEIVQQNGGIRVVQSMQPRQLLHQPQQQLRNEYGYTITQQQQILEPQYGDVQQLDYQQQQLSPPQQQPYYHHIQQPPPQQYDDGMPAVQQSQYRVVVDHGTGNEMYAAPRQQQQQPIYVSPQDQRQYIRAAPSPVDNGTQMLRRLESGSSVGSGQPMYKVQGHQQHQVPSASALYTQTQPAQTVQLDPTTQAPQQIYYSSTGQPLQQRNMSGLAAPAPVMSHHPHHLAPHQSPPPPGQQQATPQPTTVYLNAQGQQISQPPSGSYGYTTVQYHHGPTPPPQQQQRAQVVHSSIAGGVGGADMTQQQQYVSVLPVPGGPPQVTYWPSEVAAVAAAGQQGMGPTTVTIMGAPGSGGGPIVARVMQSHVDMTQQQQQQHQYGASPQSRGRGGGDKGGRGGRRGPTGGARRGGVDAKHSVHSMSSPLLDEFRATKNRDWTMHQIAGHVVEFCQDQNGSRFIQQRLELGDPAEQQVVVCEVIPAIGRLRNDVFGNYVVQKLLDFGTPQVKISIRDTLEGEMLQLSLQMYGCRVVQKALEALSEEDIPRLLVEFHHNVLSCIHDQNGNHVIQKCIEVVSNRAKRAHNNGEEARSNGLNEKIDFIINDVLVNTATLSCHPYGCRVLQRILEHCEDGRKTKVLDEIKNCHRKLLDDQYGNYVIQHVLQFGRQVDRDSILHIVVDAGLLGLSRQKFASNVVEKLLKYGNAPQRRAIVREMLKKGDDPTIAQVPAIPSDSNTSVVLLMVRDAYANYVVQTTLDVVPDSEEKTLLLEELNSHSDELRQYTFAKHIVAKLTAMNSGSP